MFNKVFEDKFNGSFIKGYELSQKCDILNVIKIFQDSNVMINNVYVNENADLGLKTFQGNYSLDEFLIKYNLIKKDIESVILSLDNNNRLYINNENYISLSSDNDIELNDLLDKSKRL